MNAKNPGRFFWPSATFIIFLMTAAVAVGMYRERVDRTALVLDQYAETVDGLKASLLLVEQQLKLIEAGQLGTNARVAALEAGSGDRTDEKTRLTQLGRVVQLHAGVLLRNNKEKSEGDWASTARWHRAVDDVVGEISRQHLEHLIPGPHVQALREAVKILGQPSDADHPESDSVAPGVRNVRVAATAVARQAASAILDIATAN